MSDPRFAAVGDHYINIEHIVYVYKEGPSRTLISLSTDGLDAEGRAKGGLSLNHSISDVLKAIAQASSVHIVA
jgi:hypothetical protein